MLIIPGQLGFDAVRLVECRDQPVVDVGQRAEAGPGDLEPARLASRVAVSVQREKQVGAVARRHRRRQHVDLDAAGLQQGGRALSDIEIDLPLLLAAPDRASLQTTQLGWHLVVLPVASLQPDAPRTGWIVERRWRKRRTEGAEEVLRPRRARRRQRIGSRRIVAGRVGRWCEGRRLRQRGDCRRLCRGRRRELLYVLDRADHGRRRWRRFEHWRRYRRARHGRRLLGFRHNQRGAGRLSQRSRRRGAASNRHQQQRKCSQPRRARRHCPARLRPRRCRAPVKERTPSPSGRGRG